MSTIPEQGCPAAPGFLADTGPREQGGQQLLVTAGGKVRDDENYHSPGSHRGQLLCQSTPSIAPRRKRRWDPTLLSFRSSTSCSFVTAKLASWMSSSVACRALDTPQHIPLGSIPQGFGLQLADMGQTHCIPLPRCCSGACGTSQCLEQENPPETQRSSRQPSCQAVQQLRDHTSAFHPAAFHVFPAELRAWIEGKPRCPCSHSLTRSRIPPAFQHMEQSCCPAQEISLLFSP